MVMPGADQFQRFDVRPLLREGHAPLLEIRQRIDVLRPGQGLAVIAPFLPSPLIDLLGNEGVQHRVERGGAGEWVVYFWRDSG